MPIQIRRGLDVPIAGVPEQAISPAPAVSRVALLGGDYVGMKPTMLVKPGDRVKLGQALFEDKKTAGVLFTSPGAGEVVEVNRGDKRIFESVVIELKGDESESFSKNDHIGAMGRDAVRDALVNSGLWTTLRRRPYGKTPSLAEEPFAIFVQAIDTNPLAPLPSLVIGQHPDDFRYGLQALTKLTNGTVHVSSAPGEAVPGGAKDSPVDRVQVTAFDGPHPAGLPGTHIHFLAPASESRPVWHLNYQDVIAIGKLLARGELWIDRVISLGGPQVTKPRLLQTRIGASVDELTKGELVEAENRVISGSVLHGRIASGTEAYLGRFHQQISVLKEGRDREFMGWQKPGFDKFSITPAYASAMASDGQRYPMTTNTNGSKRAIVPTGTYEKVMPLDIEPTFLLRALVTGDTEQAQLLGALELAEEDLALCTFVDTGKHDFAPLLRQALHTIESEG